MNKTLKVGDILLVRGLACRVIKVHPFGTYDVEAPNGAHYRVTGLF